MASTPDVGQGAVHPRLIDLFLNVVGSPLMIKEFGRGTKQWANSGQSESRIPDAPVQVEILEDFRPQQPCGSGGSDWGCVGAVRRRGRSHIGSTGRRRRAGRQRWRLGVCLMVSCADALCANCAPVKNARGGFFGI